MVDFDPSLRPIGPAPLAPQRERRRGGQGRAFDLERELGDAPREPEAPKAPDGPSDQVAPRADDEAGGRIDVTA